MKSGGGPRKGSAFERELCIQFSKWWSNEKEDDLFWRTAGSGARATVRSKKGKRTKGHYGDMCAVDNRGKKLTQAFTFSFKRGYQGVTIQDLLDILEKRREPQLVAWINELIEQAHQAGSIGWLLIIKRNQRKSLVFMPGYMKTYFSKPVYNKLEKIHPRAELCIRIGPKKRIMAIYCTVLDEFLSWIEKSDIREMVDNTGWF